MQLYKYFAQLKAIRQSTTPSSRRMASRTPLQMTMLPLHSLRFTLRAVPRRNASKRASPDAVNEMTISQAAALLRAAEAGAQTKSMHLAIRLKQDKSATPLRGSIALPRRLPSKTRVAVFARGQDALDATSAGAYIVGAEDLVTRIQGGLVDFDKCLATPECLPLLGKLARVLGPKGLMPSAKRGTVVKNVGQAITDAERNVDFRQKGSGSVLRLPVAQCDFTDDEIKRNIEAIIGKVKELGSNTAGGGGGRGTSTIDQVVVSSTHGPGIPLLLDK